MKLFHRKPKYADVNDIIEMRIKSMEKMRDYHHQEAMSKINSVKRNFTNSPEYTLNFNLEGIRKYNFVIGELRALQSEINDIDPIRVKIIAFDERR